MFSSCRYQNQFFCSRSSCSTRVALVSFVQHSCRTRVASLVSHSCRTRVVRVALVSCQCRTRVIPVQRSCCKIDQISFKESYDLALTIDEILSHFDSQGRNMKRNFHYLTITIFTKNSPNSCLVNSYFADGLLA